MKTPNNTASHFLSRAGRWQELVILFAGWAIVLALVPAYGQLDSVLSKLSGANKAGLGEEKIASGLKEALEVGTKNAVQSTGQPTGYFNNPAIKILLPQNLQPTCRGLQTFRG